MRPHTSFLCEKEQTVYGIYVEEYMGPNFGKGYIKSKIIWKLLIGLLCSVMFGHVWLHCNLAAYKLD